MRFMTTVLLAALGAGASSLMAATPMASTSPPPAGVALAPQINAADFALFDKTLSSDAFGGRKPGTIGAERTTNWLVAQFQRMGLQPGNHGSWFQAVPADSTQLLNTDVTLDITAHGKPAMSLAEAAQDPDVIASLDRAVERTNQAVSRAESIRKYRILPTDLTIANGYLTPKLSVRRNEVLKDFAHEIDALYGD